MYKTKNKKKTKILNASLMSRKEKEGGN